MSEFIIDTGKTRTEPIDYSWRNQPGAGCLGAIDCKECGCIMAAQNSHCFCMGIYTCPRCGYESKGWIDSETFEKMKMVDKKDPSGWKPAKTYNEYFITRNDK